MDKLDPNGRAAIVGSAMARDIFDRTSKGLGYRHVETHIGEKALASVAAEGFVRGANYVMNHPTITDLKAKLNRATLQLQEVDQWFIESAEANKMRLMVMMCDPEGNPRAFGIGKCLQDARTSALTQLEIYRAKKVEVGDSYLANANYTEKLGIVP